MGEISGASFSTPSSKISAPTPSTSSFPAGNYIEHKVCKMDTLAGIAIKYGVEVADIRRLNGLVTDLQMFAHKSLQIPLPGRHPPSPVQPNDSLGSRDAASRHHTSKDISNPFLSPKLKYKQPHKLSPAMSRFQEYYGLTPPKMPRAEGTEMAVYRTEVALNFGNESDHKMPPASTPQPLDSHMSKGLVKGFVPGDELYQDVAETETEEKFQSEKSVRRRQKADADALRYPDVLMREDGTGPTGRTIKGLPPRSQTDMDFVHQIMNPGEDTFMFDVLPAVKKSSSTSNLQESESGTFLKSTSKWTFKADSIAKPIFEGLQKPIIAWRSKTALD